MLTSTVWSLGRPTAPRDPRRMVAAWVVATLVGGLLGAMGALLVWWGVTAAGPPPGGDQLGSGFMLLACGIPLLGLPLGVLQSRVLRDLWGRDRWHVGHSLAWTMVTSVAVLLGATLPYLARASGTVFADMLLVGPALLLLGSQILLLMALPAWGGRLQRRYGVFCAGAGLLLGVAPLLARSGLVAWGDFSPMTLGVMLGLLLLQSGLLVLWALAPSEVEVA